MSGVHYEGTVVIYTIEGCPHCKGAKSLLEELNVPTQEVLLSDYSPELRTWLKDRTHKSSVPQIFFNDSHIGGHAELKELLKDEERLASLLKEIQENPPQMSLYIPSEEEKISKAADMGGLKEFSCEPDEYASLVEDLKTSSIMGSHKRGGFFSESVSHSFKGEEFLAWIQKERGISVNEARAIGEELLFRKFLLKVNHEDELNFDDDFSRLYRLQVGVDPNHPLNSGPTTTCAQRSAQELGEEMRRTILSIHSSHLSKDGSSVDYKGIGDSTEFQSFKRLAMELQRIDLSRLSSDEKLAFYINIYNALVIHGNIERGIPNNTWQRYKFFSTTGYNMGGLFYSLNDIENGLLRANRGSAATLFLIPFSSKYDARHKLSLSQVDPRIHFALNCGASSCPPIKTFSAPGIQEELQAATESFLETPEAIQIKGSEIFLSMLFKWYQIDFGRDRKEMLGWIERHTSRKDLHDVLKSEQDYRIRYLKYNWTNNESA